LWSLASLQTLYSPLPRLSEVGVADLVIARYLFCVWVREFVAAQWRQIDQRELVSRIAPWCSPGTGGLSLIDRAVVAEDRAARTHAEPTYVSSTRCAYCCGQYAALVATLRYPGPDNAPCRSFSALATRVRRGGGGGAWDDRICFNGLSVQGKCTNKGLAGSAGPGVQRWSGAQRLLAGVLSSALQGISWRRSLQRWSLSAKW